jgi:site-specific DNA-cytosine methylase
MASYKRSHRLHSQFVPLADGAFRFLSPREAARAQGFPPRFLLDRCLNANAVYAQLGNAVPPPLACAVVAAVMGLDSEMSVQLAQDAIRK